MKDLETRLEAIREMIDRADNTHNVNWQIGDILTALNALTDLLEATNKRIDQQDRVLREQVSIHA